VGRLSGKGTLGINQQYVWMNNFWLKHTTQFYEIQPWWIRISSNTRILYAQTTGTVWLLDYIVPHGEFWQLVANTSHEWHQCWRSAVHVG
jgi:hypothetical protein